LSELRKDKGKKKPSSSKEKTMVTTQDRKKKTKPSWIRGKKERGMEAGA